MVSLSCTSPLPSPDDAANCESSLSEYGCNTNTRKFEEVAALYNTEMTSVYSGGLVYEYSEEGSKYGLVKIDSPTSVTELPDFLALKSALAAQADPAGTGGYNATGGASGCPAQSPNWDVSGDALPAIPAGAAKLMKSGAGKGAGLSGKGSQNAGGTSTGTASAGSGSVTAVATGSASSSTSTSSGSAKSAGTQLQPMDRAPLFLGLFVAGMSFVGATLL
jgi:hypothetical protein